MWQVNWYEMGQPKQTDKIEAVDANEALLKAEVLHPGIKDGQQIEVIRVD